MKLSYEGISFAPVPLIPRLAVPFVACATSTDLTNDIPAMDLPVRPVARQSCGLDLPVVVINLPHRLDRWEAISNRMAAAGLDQLTKAPAVNGHALSDTTIARFLAPGQTLPLDAPECHLSLTRPAVGCFLSHLAVWRWVLATGVSRALVLEDDACPVTDYQAANFRAFV